MLRQKLERYDLFKRPTCPSCNSQNTATGRLLKLGTGFGVGVILSLLCYLIGFIYPLGRMMIPFLIFFGIIMAITPGGLISRTYFSGAESGMQAVLVAAFLFKKRGWRT